jgi:tetratricopeptide (TPR) repeat protein
MRKREKMKKLFVTFVATAMTASSLLAQVSDGDAHWAQRAEGHQGSRAQATHIDAAIAGYQRALAQNTNDLEARWKLLRALRFKGSYVLTNTEQKKQLYTMAKKVGEDALTAIDRQLAAKGVTSPSKATEKKVADAIRSIPNAGEVFYWDAVTWGEWALVYGKMAAVKQGAADRIKRESTIAMLTDPKIENGGGARVLGRLHNQTPHVPFITGWASDAEAVKYLKQALAQDPTNKLTRVFLAEAMVAANSSSKPQAIEMLRQVINTPNDEDYAVEQAAAQDDARGLLKDWGVK